MKKSIILIFILFLSYNSNSQIIVQNTLTPQDLVENILMGSGVFATNITYNGSPINAQTLQGNVTYFEANGTSFPLLSGVLLTSGNGNAAVGPNSAGGFSDNAPATADVSGDADLNSISSSTPTNGVILEFDFIPSGDTVSFRYLFGSDEYPEFVGAGFNDAFGFFLSGPGIAGPYTNSAINIALVPGTSTPVTIDNVSPTTNSTYYLDNQGGVTYGNAIQYDGTTVVLTAVSQVQCGQTYHIKLAICNVGDTGWDSGVFLEAESFSSEAVDVSINTVNGDTTVIENCTTAEIIFTRPSNQVADTLVVNYNVAGTATSGSDYTPLINPITFLPGEDTVVITIVPLSDGLTESPESVIITVETITECGDTILTTGTLFIIDGPELNIVEVDPNLSCFNDSIMSNVYVTNGYGPYTYTWSNSPSINDTVYFDISSNGSFDFYVFASDACGNTGMDTVTITMNQTISIDSIQIYPTSACLSDGAVSAFTSGTVGVPQFNWNGNGFTSDATVLPNIPSGWYYFTVTDDVCSAQDSAFVPQNAPPIAAMTPSISAGCSPLSVTFTNTSQNTTAYTWLFGDGTSQNTTDLNPVTHSFEDDAIVTLIAFNGSCSDTVTTPIAVSVCGCMDPEAINYNPLAEVSDNSCIYPSPEAEAPNVVTPNGDGVNDYFELTVKNTVEIEIIINNRWGNIIFDGKGPSIKWDAKGVEDGVYFYQYIARGVDGTEVNGHGFVQVFK